jgi:aryl-alcohol dehydrogenase-like predicted oxidoreductase
MTAALGLGTWPLGGAYGAVSDLDARLVLERAYDLGVRWIDTANIYGDGKVESLIGDIFGASSEIKVVTKAGYLSEAGSAQDFSAAGLRRALEGSLVRLKRPSVDIFLLHSPRLADYSDGLFEIADSLVECGLAGRAGVSLSHVDHYDLVSGWRGCGAVEVIFNLVDQRAIDKGVFEHCHSLGRVALARLPLASGLLSSAYSVGTRFPSGDVRSRWPQAQIDRWVDARHRFTDLLGGRSASQFALAFCLATPGSPMPIPGAKTVMQIEDNVAATTPTVALSEAEYSEARKIWCNIADVIPA